MVDNSPKYIFVYNQIKNDILAGKYDTGSYLPTEAKLEEIYSSSRTTIRRSIDLLKDDNLIDSRRGSGTIVLYKAQHQTDFRKIRNVKQVHGRFLIDSEHETSSPGSIVDKIAATQKIADSLKIKPGTNVYRLQHIESVNNIPFAYMINYVNTDLFPNLEQHSMKIIHFYEFLEEHYNVHYLSSEESISAVVCGFLESQLLNVEIGTPLNLFERIASCESGIFEYAETIVRPDIFRVVLKMDNTGR